jgi:hypothetical protein
MPMTFGDVSSLGALANVMRLPAYQKAGQCAGMADRAYMLLLFFTRVFPSFRRSVSQSTIHTLDWAVPVIWFSGCLQSGYSRC